MGNFVQNVKLVAGKASPEDALSARSYPASGAFVDVSGFEWAAVVVHLGAIDSGDTPGLEVKVSDAIDGTEDVIDATNCVKEVAHTDDDQVVIFIIKVEALAADHHFLSLVVADVSNASYGDIMYYLSGPARKLPVSQDSTLLPSDNQLQKLT